jgi:hypothetical protein
MWYPMWNENCIRNSAKSISQLIGESAVLKNGVRARVAAPNQPDIADNTPNAVQVSPLKIVPASPDPIVTAPVAAVLSDSDVVWNMLHQDSYCTDAAGLLDYLTELGIMTKDDLPFIDDSSQAKLVSFLKKVAASKITVLLNRLRSQAL